MKYIVVLGDGMADLPLPEFQNKTPLEYACTPTMDRLSRKADMGMVRTIPVGMQPGSDTANLAVMGYDPFKYYSGRSPLEALSMGIAMEPGDVALRCNLVTLTEEDEDFENLRILDHSSGEIDSRDSAILLEAVKQELETQAYHFYPGISYRHCLIWKEGRVAELTPPHDILGKRIGDYLPKEEVLRAMMLRSYRILKDHPLNRERRAKGLAPANCCWFWGAGTKPSLTSFEEKTGKKGMVISAVDLLKGIAVGAGMGTVDVPGATGGLHTNYEGKAAAAIEGLFEKGYDFVYIHVEGPDEMGHQGDAAKKVQAIEYLDTRLIDPLLKELDGRGERYRLLILPDHPTPISVRTHTGDKVPFLLYDSCNGYDDYDSNENLGPGAGERLPQTRGYSEKTAEATGIVVEEGHLLIERLFA
ncbi:MAG: cofactor-independent phosphoglycerate mutase [Lachnospiraceae bacterium]|nr:cofactor-independent phosphoglycerate mutase [Lachnospiraceae bacterium]